MYHYNRSNTGGPGGASARPTGTLNASPPPGSQEGPNKLNGTPLQYTAPPLSGASVTVPPLSLPGGPPLTAPLLWVPLWTAPLLWVPP